MDEIHAVLELFVSCRGSGWPLVRLEAEQQLLTQHLLMAAPMEKEEVEDLIKKCFEADNNGEINFLSFWAGMENLLELLGIREPSTHIDDKVYGLQVFRDGLLAEAMRKQQGPTNSVLLSRDEVLQIIDQTNKSVTFRHNERQMENRRCGLLQAGEACPSSLFWDEVHKETSLLEPTSVLSITELSMMVFGFLKSYLQEKSTAMRLPDGDSQDAGQSATSPDSGRIVQSTLSRASSVTSEFHCLPVGASANIGSAGATYEKDAKDQKLRSGNSAASRLACDGLEENYGDEPLRGQWRGSPRMGHALGEQQERPVSGTSATSAACSAGPRQDGGSEHRSFEEPSRSARDDILALLKTVESEDPFDQLRELLIFAGRSTESGMLSKKEVQHLRYLNAAAIDCMDRIAAERDKRNDEMNDAVLSLRRMRTEKQQLVERLEGFEHEHSQLRMQQEQHLCDQEKLHQLQAALSSGQVERERIEALLHDKEENLLCVTREKDALIDKLTSQSEHLNRLLAAAQKEKADAAEELRQIKETLTRELPHVTGEKETLEGQLRFAEDRARAAEAARQQLQGDISASTSTLRQRIVELEEDKQRQEAEAEENDALIQQLQGRLEEKVQQVTILEVKNKQQARLLQQVRGVRNCLMQILQESRQEEPVKGASYASEVETAQRDHELMKLKAGMKAALAHIKELEAFTDEMRKQHRRGVHPRYELAATSGESSARSLQKKQVDHLVGASWRALPTLGDELEMSQAPSASDSSRDGSGSAIQKQSNRPSEGRQVSEKSAFSFPRGNELTKETTSEGPETSRRRQSESAATISNEMDLKAPLTEAVATREQSATGANQIAPSSGVVNPVAPAVLRPRDSPPGAAGAEYPYAAVRSEPSTTDAVSKEPTSSASLLEAEDIFDPLDLLKFEDSVEEEGEEEPIWKGSPMRSSHEFGSKHQHYKKGASAPVPHLSAKALVASESPEAPRSSGSAKPLSGHSGSTGGLHPPLEGRRCRSRVSGSSVSNEHQRSSTSSSLISSSPKVGPALGDPVRSSLRDGIISGHALASASSDRNLLMLGAAGEAKGSPIVSVGRKIGNRSHQTRDDLATKALDASTLSGMFSMLGACAALPGAAARRADAQKNVDDDTSGNTRNAGEADSPKAKQKQSKKLSAAVAAAVSMKDPSEFRPLRRGSQGSSHLGEQFEGGSFSPPACLSRSRGSESSEKTDSAAFRSKIGSRASIRADHTPSPERRDPSPRPEHMRARRTVSLGVTEPPARHKVAALQGDDGADQHGEPSSKTHEEILEDSAGTLRKREDSGVTLRAARLPEERYTCEAECKAVLEAENLTSPLRKNDEGSKGKVDAPETCRSRENVNPRRSPRSRSSSAEPPFSKVPSSQGNTRSHKPHQPNETHETRKSSDAEQRHGQDRISRTSHHGDTEAEAPPRAMGQQSQILTEQLTLQDRSTKDRRIESCRSSSKEELRTDDQQRSKQHLQSGVQQECTKTQDEQTASAAALLAAAAGVVDASLQQQQQMIQRQREHHEDLQRAQQRRIDMLQEQLETLQKTREEQRESGEQQQRKLIETLQTKLEELQRRQEQREQDLQEAQRRLLQQELEVQLKQKLEELRCSSERQIVDTAGTCSVRNDLRGQRSHRHEPEFRTQRLSCEQRGKSCETVTNEGSLRLPAQRDNGWKRTSDAHPHTSSGNFTGSIASHSDQLLPRGKSDDNTLACHCGKLEHFGGFGGMHACSSNAQALEQHAFNASSRGVCVPDDGSSGSEETSSCASSSLMGSQCSLPLHSCVVEDATTTTSSSFISHSEKPGASPSMPSQRGSYLGTDGSFERQINALAGNRLAYQGAGLQGRESVLHRHTRLRPQPSESISASPQSMQASPGPPDSILSSCVVQRINSSAGSLWSPKASKSQATGIGDRAPRCAATNAAPSLADSVSNFNCGSMTPSAGRQEFLLQGERRYSSGGLRYPSDQEQLLRDNGAGLNRPQLSAHHPVSRAERAFALQQTPIDSARFLGGSRTGEKCQTLSDISRHQQGTLLARDSHLPAPPASARSLASTSSAVLPAQRSLLAHATKLPPYSRDHSKCSLASSDFLGVSSARSSTGRRHGDPRSSQNSDAKRSRHSKSGETQMPCSPGRPRSESGARTTRSLNTGHESLLYGPRRTVNPLLSKQQCSTASEYRSPRQRENLAFSTAGTDVPGCGHKESATRLDGSGAAAVSYRRTSTSATAPDADLSRYSSRHRQKMRHGTNREDRPDEKRGREEDKKSEISTGGNPHSAAPLSVGWSGFNGSFMSQVQKWIS